MPRANIRFYEKEGFISPERKSNGYRDYSTSDVAQLKRIIVFRKIGFSISDIKQILSNEKPLDDMIEQNIVNLEKQITELNGALSLSKEMAHEKMNLESFDEELYFKKIYEEENSGNAFNDILNDCIEFEKNIFAKMWKSVFLLNFADMQKRHGFF